MNSFCEIVERIKDVMSTKGQNGEKKLYDKDVATALGLTQANFATMKNRDVLPYKELALFCAQNKISINWLLFDQSPESLIESTNRYYHVRYFNDIHASAGGGAFNWDEGYEDVAIDERFVPLLGGERAIKNIEAINVVGDSMEPSLKDGDIIFLDKNKTDITKGGIFVIATEFGIFTKRLQNRFDGKVDIISDNKEYGVQTAKLQDITVIGKVVRVFGSAR